MIELDERLTQNRLDTLGMETLKGLALAFYKANGYQPGSYVVVPGRGQVYQRSPSLAAFKGWLEEILNKDEEPETFAAPAAEVNKIDQWLGSWQPYGSTQDYAEALKKAWFADTPALDDLIYLLSACNTYTKKGKDPDDPFFKGLQNVPPLSAGTKVDFKIKRAKFKDYPDRDFCQWFVVADDDRLYDFFLADTIKDKFGDLNEHIGARLYGTSLGERVVEGSLLSTHIRLATDLLKTGVKDGDGSEKNNRAIPGFFR